MPLETVIIFTKEGATDAGTITVAEDAAHTTTVSFPANMKQVPVPTITTGTEYVCRGKSGKSQSEELLALIQSQVQGLGEKEHFIAALYGAQEQQQNEAYWMILKQLMADIDVTSVESWCTSFAHEANAEKVVLYDLVQEAEAVNQAYMEESAREGTKVVGLTKHNGKADVASMQAKFQAAVDEMKDENDYCPMHSLTVLTNSKEQRVSIYLLAESRRPTFAATSTVLQQKYEVTQRENGGVIAVCNSIRFARRRIPFLACKCTSILRPYLTGDDLNNTKILFAATLTPELIEESVHTANAVNRIRNNGLLTRMLTRHVEMERWRVALDTHLLETHLAIVQKAYKHTPVVYNQGLQDDLLTVAEATIDKLKKKQASIDLKQEEEDKERIAAIVNDYNTAKQRELEEETHAFETLKRRVKDLESDLEDLKLMKDPGSSAARQKQRLNQLVDELPILRDQVATRENEIKRLRATSKANPQAEAASSAFKATSPAEQESIRRKIALTKVKNNRQLQIWHRQIAAYDEKLPHAMNRAFQHVTKLSNVVNSNSAEEIASFGDAVNYAKETVSSVASLANNLLPVAPTAASVATLNDARNSAAVLIDQHRAFFVSEYSRLLCGNPDVSTFKVNLTFISLLGATPRSAEADYTVSFNLMGKEVASPAARFDPATRQIKWMFTTGFEAQLQKAQDGSWSRTPLVITVVETDSGKRDFIPWELDLGVLVGKSAQAYALTFEKLHLKIHVSTEQVRENKRVLQVASPAAEKDRRVRNPLWASHFHPFLCATNEATVVKHVDPVVSNSN